MSNLLKKEKGFTLIEIVLVMAIAGLILVIVFLAVQGAQRGRRDNARKHDAARFLAAAESCASNNNGQYNGANPCTAANLMSGATPYFAPNIGPSGVAYNASNSVTPAVGDLSVAFPGTCNGTSHPAAAYVALENGGTYCVGN